MSPTFLQQTTTNSGATTYNFASQNLGTADTNRYIIVCIAGRKTGASTTITNVVVAGITATEVTQVSRFVTNTNISGIFIAAVPTGTTGTVSVTYGAAISRCFISLYRVLNVLTPTGYDFAAVGATDPSTTLDIPANGFAVGTGITAANTTATLTNMTEDYDTVASNTNFAGGDRITTTAETGTSLVIDFATTGSEPCGCFASWGPTGATEETNSIMQVM